jgi:hypothetical protein
MPLRLQNRTEYGLYFPQFMKDWLQAKVHSWFLHVTAYMLGITELIDI